MYSPTLLTPTSNVPPLGSMWWPSARIGGPWADGLVLNNRLNRKKARSFQPVSPIPAWLTRPFDPPAGSPDSSKFSKSLFAAPNNRSP